MARKRTNTAENTQRYDNPPKTLDEHPFFGLKLDDDQRNYRDGIWDPQYDIIFCDAPAGSGKAQPLDTLIPTPNGWKRLGEINVGDYVFDRYGNPTLVSGVFDQGKQRAYKVVLNDGRSTVCAKEHLWSFYSSTAKDRLITETLGSMMERALRVPGAHSGNRYALPLNGAVHYSTKEYSVDPYVIGAFLGDGCCKQRALTISSSDEFIPNEIGRLIDGIPVKSPYNYSWTFNLGENANKTVQKSRSDIFKWQTKMLFADYPEMIGDCKEKRIPSVFKYGDVEQRVALLQGLFDTDGCIVQQGKKFSVTYNSINKELIYDIAEVVNSLGFYAKIRKQDRPDKNSAEYELRVISSHRDKYLFFRLPRKKDIAFEAIKYDDFHKYDRIRIKDIVDLGYECDMRCIYVENDEHLYLTNDYIVTHNTQLAVATALLMCEYGMYDSIVYMSAAGVHEHKSGYLPGTMAEKAAPLTQPLYQAVAKLGYAPEQTIVSDQNIIARKEGRALITTMTDNYIRGINIGSDDNRVIYIIDEAQNFTVDGLRTALTRVNEGSKTIVIGHHAQCDLKFAQDSGFVPYMNHFATEPWCKVCKLTKNYRGRVSAHADKL